FSRFSGEQVLPLMTTSWHQWWPYNAYYPKDPVFFPEENGFYRTGCLPLAAVQVAKFWNYPDKGRWKINVNDPAWGTFTRDFSKVVFDWKNMPDFMPIDKNMPEQQYSPSASLVANMALATINFGASLIDYASAFSTYWKYSSNADVIEKRSFTDDEWLRLCKSDLDKGRPLMTTGSSDVDGQGGHAFVVDGYQAGSYFHCNFGWSDLNGYMNGYFQLNNLGGHLHNNTVLLNLQPEKNNPQLGGPYTADSNTVLLMHFNGSLKDEISAANASMHGSGISFAPSDSLGLGQCLKIDNSTSSKQAYLTVPYNQKMNLSGDWTIEAWVYISSWKAPHTMYPYIIAKPGSSAWWDVNYSLKLNAGESAPIPEYGLSSVNNEVEQFYCTKNTIEPGRWYHLAFVRKTASRNIRLLIHDTNKQLIFCRTQPYINTDARKPRLNFNDLFIGWLGMDYNTYFDGSIDELRISNVARDFETGSQQVNVFVWPGDADNDGKVKSSDVLPLGFFYGKTGPSRAMSEQGSAWKAVMTVPWDIYKSAYADCNGDGLVDVKDILSIGYNYNKIISPSSGNSPSARAGYISATAAQNSPNLNIRFISKGQVFSDLRMLHEGDEFCVSVLLTNAKDLLGISFNLNWDKDLFDVISTEEDLKLGDIWQNDALAVNKLINEEGRYETGITNTSGNPVKTDGEVLQLIMKLKKEAIQAKFDILEAQWMDIRGNKFIFPSDGKLTNISDVAVKIKDYELLSYPNPFNPSANIRFSMPLAGKVYIKIFNALGREVASLINGDQYQSGEYTLQWNASAFPSGFYVCRFVAGSKVISRKILLVK
ncbi:MAG: C10 family peptidase, partial [Bacteroidota bacterium]|nr:C10 family peptidase [Bacteroidota bacterium]